MDVFFFFFADAFHCKSEGDYEMGFNSEDALRSAGKNISLILCILPHSSLKMSDFSFATESNIHPIKAIKER